MKLHIKWKPGLNWNTLILFITIYFFFKGILWVLGIGTPHTGAMLEQIIKYGTIYIGLMLFILFVLFLIFLLLGNFIQIEED